MSVKSLFRRLTYLSYTLMTYERFEDLPVWKEAMRLATVVYDLTEDESFRGSASLRDQLERASLSFSNNIAEGFERGTTNELLYFLYIARGSAGETRSMLHFLNSRKGMKAFSTQIKQARALAVSCSRQLRSWADSLQNSNIEGQRHLNDKSRKQFESAKRAAEFPKKLEAMIAASKQGRKPMVSGE